MKKKLLYLFVFVLVSLISKAEGYAPKIVSIPSNIYSRMCIYGDSVWIQNSATSFDLWSMKTRKKMFSVSFPVSGMTPSQITTTDIDKNGIFWVATKGYGVFALINSEWISYNTNDGLPSNNVNDLFFESDTLWIATDGGIGKYYNSNWTSLTNSDGLPSYIITAIARDTTATLVIGTGNSINGGVYKFLNGTWELFDKTNGLGDSQVNCLSLDFSGQLWVGTNNGLGKIMNDTIINYVSGFTNKSINAIIPLKSEELWLDHHGAGYTVFKNQTAIYTPLISILGGSSRYVNGITSNNNKVYVYSSDIILEYDEYKNLTLLNFGYFGINVNIVKVDKKNNVWFTINGPDFIYKYNTLDSTFKQIFLNGYNNVDVEVFDIMEDSRGDIWFVGYDNLIVYNDDSIRVFDIQNTPVFKTDYFYRFSQDSDGNVWVTSDNGVYYFDGNEWKEFSASNQLLSQKVKEIVFNENVIWFKYVNAIGVSKFDGVDMVNYAEPQIVSNNITSIIKDNENNVYLASSKGLSKYDNGTFSKIELKDLLQTNLPPSSIDIKYINFGSDNMLFANYNAIFNEGGETRIYLSDSDTVIYYRDILSMSMDDDIYGNIWFSNYNKYLAFLRKPPVLFSEITDTICLGTSISFKNLSSSEITPIGWDINPVANVFDANKIDYYEENPTHLFDKVGTFKVRLYGTNGIDTNFVTKSVTVLPSPSVIIKTVDNKNTICENSILTLDARGDEGLSFEWSTGSDSVMIEVEDAGMYYLLSTNSYGCSDKDSFELHVNTAPIISISASEQNGKFCQQSSITLSALSDYSDFKWSNNETTKDITIAVPGTYTVTVSDNIGCEGVAQFDVSYFEPTPAQIGIVTASELDEFLIVAWEKVGDENIASYNVYQLNGSEYSKIGSVDKAEPGLFLDKTSDFKKRAYTYKITTVDQCGSESSLNDCEPHTSMHLVEIPSDNKYYLLWTPYRGIDPVSYTIYQTTDGTDMDIIETVSAIYNTTYTVTDYDPSKRFRVAMNPGYSIDPNAISELKTDSGPFSQSISNISESELTGLKNIEESTEIILFPIPASTSINVAMVGEVNENTVVGLYSSTGVLIDYITLQASLNASVSFNTSSLSKGLYEIKVVTEKSSIVRKFIKK